MTRECIQYYFSIKVSQNENYALPPKKQEYCDSCVAWSCIMSELKCHKHETSTTINKFSSTLLFLRIVARCTYNLLKLFTTATSVPACVREGWERVYVRECAFMCARACLCAWQSVYVLARASPCVYAFSTTLTWSQGWIRDLSHVYLLRCFTWRRWLMRSIAAARESWYKLWQHEVSADCLRNGDPATAREIWIFTNLWQLLSRLTKRLALFLKLCWVKYWKFHLDRIII